MSFQVLRSKMRFGSRITDGCCSQQWRNMAPNWLRAAAPLFSRESGRANGGQEFDDAEPVLLILPVRLEIVFVLCCQDRQIPLFPEFWFKTRGTRTVQRKLVLYGS